LIEVVACSLDNLRTVSETNVTGSPRTRMARRKGQRYATYTWLSRLFVREAITWPAAVVTITRVAPRELDDDNLQSALKSVRDGIADWWDSAYKHGDDRQTALIWCYAQKRGKPRQYGVDIVLRPRAD
jgi:hypothetical protein